MEPKPTKPTDAKAFAQFEEDHLGVVPDGCQLTPEECYYLYRDMLASEWIPRGESYTIIKQAIAKVYQGAKGYTPKGNQ